MITNETSVTLTEPEFLGPRADSAAATPTYQQELCHTLDGARSHLTAARIALDGWYTRQTTEEHTYVADGHDAIRLIDSATRTLYRVRGALIGEIRADEDERAARVDRLLAECRARRAAAAAVDSEHQEAGA